MFKAFVLTALLGTLRVHGMRSRQGVQQAVNAVSAQVSTESATSESSLDCCSNQCCKNERYNKDWKIKRCMEIAPQCSSPVPGGGIGNPHLIDPGCCHRECCRNEWHVPSQQREKNVQWCTANGPITCKKDPGCCRNKCCQYETQEREAKQQWCVANGISADCPHTGFPGNGGNPHFPVNPGNPGSFPHDKTGCCTNQCCRYETGFGSQEKQQWCRTNGYQSYCTGNGGNPGSLPHDKTGCCTNQCCRYETGFDSQEKQQWCRTNGYQSYCTGNGGNPGGLPGAIIANPGCCSNRCCRYESSFRREEKQQWCMSHGYRSGCPSVPGNGGFPGNGGNPHFPGNGGNPGMAREPQCCRTDCCGSQPTLRQQCVHAGFYVCRDHSMQPPQGSLPIGTKTEVCCICEKKDADFWGRERTTWISAGDYTVGKGNAMTRCNHYCSKKCPRKGPNMKMAGCWAEARMQQFQREAQSRHDWLIQGMPNDRWDGPFDIC